jgi:hypothetical protein
MDAAFVFARQWAGIWARIFGNGLCVSNLGEQAPPNRHCPMPLEMIRLHKGDGARDKFGSSRSSICRTRGFD